MRDAITASGNPAATAGASGFPPPDGFPSTGGFLPPGGGGIRGAAAGPEA